MADQVMINGNQLSWNEVILRINGEIYSGITSISYGEKREPVFAYGMGRSKGPRGRTSGKYSTDPLKITAFKDTALEIKKQLAALSKNGKAYGEVEVPITLQFAPTDGETQTVEFERAKLSTVSNSAEESSDPTKSDMEFSFFRLRENGLTLWDSTDEA